MATSLPRYAVVAFDRNARGYRVLGTSNDSMASAMGRAKRHRDADRIFDGGSSFLEVFLPAPTASQGMTAYLDSVGNQGFGDDEAKSIVKQLRTAAQAQQAAQQAAPRLPPLPPVPPEGVGPRELYYSRIRQAGATVDTPGEAPKFDLPARRETIRADEARRAALLQKEGKTCRWLPHEGGPYKYSICLYADYFTVSAAENGKYVGTASLQKLKKNGRTVYKMSIEVDKPKYQLKETDPEGLGTRLYERSARAACRVGRAYAITSDTIRSVFSEAFWRKQVRKGRATCKGDGNLSHYYSYPLVEAKNYFYDLEGRMDGPKWRAFYAGLPKPENDGWTCDYYELPCRGLPDTLGKLRIGKLRVKKKRSR